MEASEIAVWSAMLGGLLTLLAMAVFDTVASRSVAALRNLLFVVIAGGACVVMTGLPQVFWPELPQRMVMLSRIILVPTSGAIVLNYLGSWLGGLREDVIVHRMTARGSAVLFLLAIVVALLAILDSSQDLHELLVFAAAINMTAVVLGLVACIRAAALGDPLARWMVLACVFLAATAGGLFLRGLDIEGFGLGTWIVTAAVTVGFFLTASVLVIMRNRQNRQLARLAGLEAGADPATGLPTGSVLLAKAGHAFWRTARLHGECTVVCLHLHNLYELGETAGHGVEHQILAAVAARIRRAAGFRCIVGLYHPRCFVVVISADKRRQFVNITVGRLRALVGQPLSVVSRDALHHDFTPRVGFGVITLDPTGADPLDVITNAERQALGPQIAPRTPESEAATTW
jgi:GGDEF domain-containing protein